MVTGRRPRILNPSNQLSRICFCIDFVFEQTSKGAHQSK
jgi:hypothetical protein